MRAIAFYAIVPWKYRKRTIPFGEQPPLFPFSEKLSSGLSVFA